MGDARMSGELRTTVLRFEREGDVVEINFADEIGHGEVVRDITIEDAGPYQISLAFDSNHRLLSLEVIGVDECFRPEFLERLGGPTKR